jgi:ABC-type branched-subunit amino acid transport system ATPase component
MTHILSARNVTKRFGGLVAVNDLTVEIESGQIYAVIGPNGAGKTTFFNLITGFYKLNEGVIDLTATSSTASRRTSPSSGFPTAKYPPVFQYEAIETSGCHPRLKTFWGGDLGANALKEADAEEAFAC